MQHHLVAFTLAALTTASWSCAAAGTDGSFTPEETAALAPVVQFINGFNAGDVAAAIAACTDPVTIIDEFPPYEWHGAGAMTRWLTDYAKDAQQNVISDGIVTLHDPKHVDVVGDRAYVVAPVNYEFKMDGKAVKETNSTLTIVLIRTSAGWRITSWAWSKN